MSSFKSSRLEIQNNSFSRLGVRNKIPRYITDLPKKAFKRVLRKLLFDILEREDDYIQIHIIIKKSRYIDTLAQGFHVCFSFSVSSFKSQGLLVLMHCTSL